MFDAFLHAWRLPLPPTEKLMFLAVAYHADKEGRGAHPGIALLCEETGLAKTQTKALLGSLVSRGLLIPTPGTGRGPRNRTDYTINLHVDIQWAGTATQLGNEPVQRPNDAIEPVERPINEPVERPINEPVQSDKWAGPHASAHARPVPSEPDHKPGIETASARAYTRDADNGAALISADGATLLESKYWLEYEDDDRRRRAVDPRSDWGYDQFLRKVGESSWTAQESVWRPQYRKFCNLARQGARVS